MNEKDKEKIFEVRKDYTEKVVSWGQRVFYFIIFFLGAVDLALISNIDKFLINNWIFFFLIIIPLVISIEMIFIVYLEMIFFININQIYRKFIEDISSGNIQKLEKISFKSQIKDGLNFYKDNWR